MLPLAGPGAEGFPGVPACVGARTGVAGGVDDGDPFSAERPSPSLMVRTVAVSLCPSSPRSRTPRSWVAANWWLVSAPLLTVWWRFTRRVVSMGTSATTAPAARSRSSCGSIVPSLRGRKSTMPAPQPTRPTTPTTERARPGPGAAPGADRSSSYGLIGPVATRWTRSTSSTRPARAGHPAVRATRRPGPGPASHIRTAATAVTGTTMARRVSADARRTARLRRSARAGSRVRYQAGANARSRKRNGW